ncbi:MAG: hypothetical protein M3Y81_15485 [Chloroflexota bacterium]|nr:hypothetical protein [Chloroflexota bacterium]
MAFMFSSGLGWGRRLIEVGDWQQIRLPGTILASDSVLWTKVLQLERWLRENWQSALEASLAHEISAKENELNQTIFQLYDLSEQERILVEDTLQYSIKPFLFRKKLPNIEAYSEPTLHELEVYAKRVCLQLDGILRYSNARIVPNIIAFGQKSPLSICQFTQNGRMENGSLTSIRVSRVAGLEEVLSMLSATLRIEVADHLSLRRNLRIYDGKSFWVIKPSEKRLWSETAALSDADAIVREHMEVSATGAAITMVLW